MRSVLLSPRAFEELGFWFANEPTIVAKIFALIRDIQRVSFRGLGKPEALKRDFQGLWSRRITGEHRLVYKVEGDVIKVIQCRCHYDK